MEPIKSTTSTPITEPTPIVCCSVCIATYHRPQLLAKLLDSLLEQTLPPHVKLEIIVVDNDAAASAQKVIDAYQDAPYQIHYAVEPRKNISLARNKSVELATGDYLLFIDDDETAPPDWVVCMLTALQTYKADGVFGRVISDFHPTTAGWVKSVYLFNRLAPPTGSIALATRTSNCLVKAALVKSEPGPFDEAYGITGGEDTHLFGRLRQKGAHFVNCYEGWVAEFIPLERTTRQWIIKRAFRTGNLFGRRQIELTQAPFLKRATIFFIGLGKLMMGIFLTLIHFPHPQKRWHWFLKTAANWGQVLAAFDIKIDGY